LKALVTKLSGKDSYGKGTLALAASNVCLDIPRLPTGVFAVDYALGGGVPKGRISSFYGDWSSGKTFLALKTVAASQLFCRKHHRLMAVDTEHPLLRCPICGSLSDEVVCKNCTVKDVEVHRVDRGDYAMACPVCKEYDPYWTLWCDTEGVYSNRWASQLGINGERVIVARPEYAEQLLDIYEVAWRELDYLDISVVDSLAMATPLTEVEESAEKQQQGLQARILNKFMRKAVAIQNSQEIRATGRRPTQIFINQIREKIGILFGDPTTKPGGRGQDFVASTETRLWRSRIKTKGKNDEPTVGLCKFQVTKNKTGAPPQRSGSFRIWFRDDRGHAAGSTNEAAVLAHVIDDAGLVVDSEGKLFSRKEAEKAEVPHLRVEEAASLFSGAENVVRWHSTREALLPHLLGAVRDEKEDKDAS